MRQFGAADRIVAILSDKYLRSVACMSELFYVWQTSQADPEKFQSRVCPLVLNDAQISQTEDRLHRVRHWHNQERVLLAAQVELAANFGIEDQRELKLVGEFARHVSDILRWLNDVLMPRGFEALMTDDFRELIALLQGRL
jgi:hypothetical protein